MPKQPAQRVIAGQRAKKKKVVKGRGDYSFADGATPVSAAKLAAATNDLDARMQRLEATAPSTTGNSFRNVGEALGQQFGFGGLGKKAGGALSMLLGHGDYVVKTNSLMPGKNDSSSNAVPLFSKDGKRGIRVTEREYIGDVTSGGTLVSSATSFSLKNFRLNPGMSNTFPWLSTIAQNFDQWEPLGIVFEFVSTSSEYNGTSQALGTVIMATDYDAVDANFASKIQMENEDFANSTKSSQTAMHGIECDKAERADKVMNIRSASVPAGAVIADYDLGNFQIATQGMSAANVNIGELWISYDIVLYKKNLFAGQLGNGVYAANVYATTGFDSTHYLGTNPISYGGIYLAASGNVLTFPTWITAGKYTWVAIWRGTSAASTVPTVAYTNAASVAAFTGSSAAPNSNGSITTSSYYLMDTMLISGPAATITLSGGALPSSITSLVFYLCQVPVNQHTAITVDSVA